MSYGSCQCVVVPVLLLMSSKVAASLVKRYCLCLLASLAMIEGVLAVCCRPNFQDHIMMYMQLE
jgi:hypothetical protein